MSLLGGLYISSSLLFTNERFSSSIPLLLFLLFPLLSTVLTAHNVRNQKHNDVFSTIDTSQDGVLDRVELESYVRKHLVLGREQGGYFFRRHDGVEKVVDNAMDELDTNKDGYVSWETFQEWSRSNSLESMVDQYANQQLQRSPSRRAPSRR